MDIHEGKYAWMVKIGEKGQFVIPKEARDMFGFHPGDEILVLGDKKREVSNGFKKCTGAKGAADKIIRICSGAR